jgi:hypothetical protein
MTRIQLRMNGLDTFGRMAGMLGGIFRGSSLTDVFPTELLSAPAADATATAEPPELSTAVILHSEECRKNTEELTEQLALF